MAIGTSWRPTQGANIVVEINPPTKRVILPNGKAWTPYGGNVFVRYSPDKRNWSSWQVLGQQDAQTNRTFRGRIEVPRIEREKYDKFVSQYSRLDVAWRSDEDAAVKWILQQQPDFFEKQLPFIGYIQFRFEGDLAAGQRIERIRMQLVWMVGGLSATPKNPDVDKGRDGAWKFEAP